MCRFAWTFCIRKWPVNSAWHSYFRGVIGFSFTAIGRARHTERAVAVPLDAEAVPLDAEAVPLDAEAVRLDAEAVVLDAESLRGH